MEAKSEGKPVIIVTGSAGLIGTKCVEAFARGYTVVGMDVKPPEKGAAGTDFIECDLTKDESVAQALDAVREKHGDRIASVIHLAAYYDFSGEPSEMYRKLTGEGTFRLLKKLQEFQTEQFVFSSSPALQNDIIVGWLLLMFAIIPNEASFPPRSWRSFSREREGTADLNKTEQSAQR